MSRLLEQVAAAYGIERAYVDNTGRLTMASPETLQALLAAMGVPAGSRGDLGEALERVTRARAQPPVLVAAAGADTALPLASAEGEEWRLTLEDGTELAGAVQRDAVRRGRILVPEPLPMGYHRLLVTRGDGEPRETLVIAAPERCRSPEELGIDRVFGLAAQVYGLRSPHDPGSGDFAGLADLAAEAAEAGADFVGMSPLHASFFADPGEASPYSPSSRAFRNWLLVAPEPGGEAAGGPGGDLIDYREAAARRLRLLEASFARFREQHLGARPSQRGKAFRRFVDEGGEALRRQCLFDALHERQLARDRGRWAWWDWPEDCRTPDGPGVTAFAQEAEERLEFLAWVQWQADEQLGQAAARARKAGMRVGLYADLAVGVNPAGAQGWSAPDVVIRGATIGAPPDAFSQLGQNWGIAPLAPRALQEQGFAHWIADIRANMRHAGALRIDHAMGLRRLFWIPAGGSPSDGTYVRYPFTAHLAILAIESHRANCLVIAEDLGTVPRGFRPALRRAGILSSRVLYFERERTGNFGPARRYRHASLASIGTHDLPTLLGFLHGTDIAWRERLNLFPDANAAAEARRERDLDVQRLRRMLERAGLVDADAGEIDEATLTLALHRWLARTPAALLQVSLEDLIRTEEQPNLPGTVDQHPNWRRRYPADAASLFAEPFAQRLLAALREERPPERPGGREEPARRPGVLASEG